MVTTDAASASYSSYLYEKEASHNHAFNARQNPTEKGPSHENGMEPLL
jgi:hypothetical protein